MALSNYALLLSLILLVLLLLLYSTISLLSNTNSTLKPVNQFYKPVNPQSLACADPTDGRWVYNHSRRRPLYDATCPFHRNAWNCFGNGRENMAEINSWEWVPRGCPIAAGGVPRIDPVSFLKAVEGMRIGFIGDSLNENFVVAFLCSLRAGDEGARKWKRKRAWRGGFFPKYNVTVGYHRAVLLAKNEWQPAENAPLTEKNGLKKFCKVDVDIPADEWVNVTKFYDILIFNTGHWWGFDKFSNETPLIFYRDGKPILPPLSILEGLQMVLDSMVSYIEREVPKKTLKFWRTQSPRHFYGGEWNQNGSCLSTEPLREEELDSWFDPVKNGVNKEARQVNSLIQQAVQGTQIRLLNLTHLSEFRADAHPAIWLGKKMLWQSGARIACIGAYLAYLIHGLTSCRLKFYTT